MLKILTGAVFLMIFGWFVFVNDIDYGVAPEQITKGWPMTSYDSPCLCVDHEYPKAIAVNWGLALVVSVVGTLGARTIYRMVVSRLSRVNKQTDHVGASAGDNASNEVRYSTPPRDGL